MRESHPLHWFVREIDIGDPPLDTRSDCGTRARYKYTCLKHNYTCLYLCRSKPHYMMPLQRTRSRHDCNFIPGTPFLNAGKIIIHLLWLSLFIVNLIFATMFHYFLLHEVVFLFYFLKLILAKVEQ